MAHKHRSARRFHTNDYFYSQQNEEASRLREGKFSLQCRPPLSYSMGPLTSRLIEVRVEIRGGSHVTLTTEKTYEPRDGCRRKQTLCLKEELWHQRFVCISTAATESLKTAFSSFTDLWGDCCCLFIPRCEQMLRSTHQGQSWCFIFLLNNIQMFYLNHDLTRVGHQISASGRNVGRLPDLTVTFRRTRGWKQRRTKNGITNIPKYDVFQWKKCMERKKRTFMGKRDLFKIGLFVDEIITHQFNVVKNVIQLLIRGNKQHH